MTVEDTEVFYQILGLSKTASIDEIKHAYRKKAKAFHPDKNKSPDAAEQFILFTEAYENLTNIKDGKIFNTQSVPSDEWETDRAKSRRQARQHADMKYEEFKKTVYYKNSQAAATVFEHLYFFSSVLIMLSPVWGFIINGLTGFLVGVFITFISVQFWAGIFKEEININFNSFFQSILLIFKTRTFMYGTLTLMNVILFFRVTLNTQLSLGEFSLILIALFGIAFLIYYFRSSITNAFSKLGRFLCLVPSVFNIFFLVNYVFSSNPSFENYPFVHETRVYMEAGDQLVIKKKSLSSI